MNILFRYLTKEIFLATLLLLASLLSLYAVFDTIKELGDVGKSGYTFSAAMKYVALLQPTNIVTIFPVAALLGTLIALSRLSNNSELTVMRATGFSLSRLAVYITAIGLSFTTMMFLFGELVAPAAQDWAKRLRMSATSSVVAQQFRSGFWVKDERSFVNIELMTHDTKLLNVRIYDFDASHHLNSITVAQSATYGQQNAWELAGVDKTTFSEAGARTIKQPTLIWHSALTPALLTVLKIQPSEMKLLDLSAYIDHLRDNKQNSTRYEFALWAKLFSPLLIIVMMLLAIPFAIQSNRKGGAGGQLLLGTMIGLTFHFLNQLTSNLTVLHDWPPLMSAAIPVMLFMLMAVVLLYLKEHPYALRSWQAQR